MNEVGMYMVTRLREAGSVLVPPAWYQTWLEQQEALRAIARREPLDIEGYYTRSGMDGQEAGVF